MGRFLSRRFAQAVLVILGITLVTFVISFAVPADPARMIAGRSASAATVASIRHQLGLDQPLPVQYLRYLGQLARGNLGRSYVERTTVASLIAARLPATLELMAGAIFFELLLGLPAGVFGASRRGTQADKTAMVLSFVGVSAPQFVVGLLLLYAFGYLLGLFPLGGYGGLSHLILPALTLGIAGGGWYARQSRSSMVDALRQDYVRTARAKGASEWRAVVVHAGRNAVLPVVAMIGLDIGNFMQGVIVVEAVFGWPGIGQLTWQAIQQLDIPVIMGVTIVAALAIVLGNLLADIITGVLDPRVRLR
ncbi:MAG: ABC transporter permease [Acetobacteraceae bacterium]